MEANNLLSYNKGNERQYFIQSGFKIKISINQSKNKSKKCHFAQNGQVLKSSVDDSI